MKELSKEQLRNWRKKWKKEEEMRFENFLIDLVNLISYYGRVVNHERYGYALTEDNYDILKGATGKSKYLIKKTVSKFRKQGKLIHIKYGAYDNKVPLCAYTRELLKFFQNKLKNCPSVKSCIKTKNKKISNKELKKILINADKILQKITKREYKNENAVAEAIKKQIDGEDAKTWLLTIFLTREALALKTITQKVSEQQNDMMFR